MTICFSNDWQFSEDGVQFHSVTLPHNAKEVPLQYFDEKMYQHSYIYRKFFDLDLSQHQRAFFVFEGVMAEAKIVVNGQELVTHKGGYTEFTCEITHAVCKGKNEVVVLVNSSEKQNIPPFGHTIDYLTFSGIYRDVTLKVTDEVAIEEVFAQPSDVLTDNIKLNVSFVADASVEQIRTFNCEINGQKQELTTRLQAGKNQLSISFDQLDVSLWDIDHPNLYSLRLETSGEQWEEKIGFREAKFTDHGFLLNGNPIKLVGLNRHQSYPYVGYAMPKRVQEKDADILKNELNLNLVRTSHYPQSKHFLNRCDELGLLVFEEIPGWQYIGDAQWKEIAKNNVKEMILAHRNHPSIILWGVRINESADDDEFYLQTNQIAKSFDSSRQTGGVRCFENSHLLEDVYTMNDFIWGFTEERLRSPKQVTGLEKDVPYLVTEFAGHMYPTKSYDQEERMIQHIHRHMEVHAKAAQDDTISGAIGWCAFDYQTHQNFGSGDRICYHGVMDIFRLPKMASYFYKSQKSPKKEVVMELASRWAYGERNMGGVYPLEVYTNCDYVEIFLNGKTVPEAKAYPDHTAYPGILHPPCIIGEYEDRWGMPFEDAKLVGYIDQQPVIEREYTASPILSELYVACDDHTLYGTVQDATRVVVKALDQKGNILPFAFFPLRIEVSGPIMLVGDDMASLIGGKYAFWIKTTGQTGKGKIKVKSPSLSQETEILIV